MLYKNVLALWAFSIKVKAIYFTTEKQVCLLRRRSTGQNPSKVITPNNMLFIFARILRIITYLYTAVLYSVCLFVMYELVTYTRIC